MDMNSMFGFMDILVLGCGLYIIYGYYLLMTKGELKEGILISKNTDPRKCKDIDSYRKFIGLRMLLFGISAVVSGALGLYQDFVGNVNMYVYMGGYVFFFAAMIWFLMGVRKAERIYW